MTLLRAGGAGAGATGAGIRRERRPTCFSLHCEAHPGENFPAHRSIEQKFSHATIFKEQFNIQRPILVDDLVGTGHKLYGVLPNMTYLIGRGGKVLFRADWTDPPTIEMIPVCHDFPRAKATGIAFGTILRGDRRLSLERYR